MAFADDPRNFTLFGFVIGGDMGPLTYYTHKQKQPVCFLKAPPKEPPTEWQVSVRNGFRLAAFLWNRLTVDHKKAWHELARRTSLPMHGYNLFVSLHLRPNPAAKKTLERQAGITLP